MKAKKSARKYGSAAAGKPEKTVKERRQGGLRTGTANKKVTSGGATGLSEARKAGAKMPARKAARSKKSRTKKGA